MSDFAAAVARFQAEKALASAIRKPVAVLYELQPYEDDNGSQGTRFKFVHHRSTVDEIIEEVDNSSQFNAESIFLIVERELSAAGDYYTEEGKLVKGPPTEGILRDRIMERFSGAERLANNEWVDVYNIREGIESEPASAATDESRPHGWAECCDKYGIEIDFTRADE